MTPSFIYQDQLQTQRLYTRFLTQADNLPWSDFYKDGEATMYFPTSDLIFNEEKARWWVGRQLTRYKENRLGLQALISKQTNEFIGQCGLLIQQVDGRQEIEVGYHIFKRYWGQGFALEAAKLFIDYAFKNNLTTSVISIIDIRNTKSMRVAAKNGLIKEKQTTWSDVDVYIYRIDKGSWN